MNPRPAAATLLGALALLYAACGAGAPRAQPLPGRVLEDVSTSGRCLTVTLSFPLQYVSHFPFAAGTTLRIRLRRSAPVGRIDGDAPVRREVARPPGRRALHISDVAFEGDAPGGPYLVVNFDRETGFRVGQGRDFRSFVIAILEGGVVPPCFQRP